MLSCVAAVVVAVAGRAVARRVQYLVNERMDLPDLMIIDGGPTQLTRALEAARNFTPSLKIISIAKRFEELYTDPGQEPLRLPSSSPGLKLIQNIRDEAHRFAVSYHRMLRDKKTTRSVLDEIPLSEKTKRLLLDRFKSIDAISRASKEEMEDVAGIGAKTALKIFDFFRKREAG